MTKPCPICGSTEKKTHLNGKYYCPACGCEIDAEFAQQMASSDAHRIGKVTMTGEEYNRKYEALLKEKSNKLMLGVLFVFFFWPVCFYFFYKSNQAKKELKQLEADLKAAVEQKESGSSAPKADLVTVTLMDAGTHKLEIIKEIRLLTSLDLAEAKEMAEQTPSRLLTGCPRDKAEAFRDAVTALGGDVRLW